MKMFLLQKQAFKEAYRYFMTMISAMIFLILLFHISHAGSQNNDLLSHYAWMVLLMGYALTCPVVLFSYLYHPVDVHHVASIPMTRFEVFFSYYLLGLMFGLGFTLGSSSLTILLVETQSEWLAFTSYLIVFFLYYYHMGIFCYWICGNKLFYVMMIMIFTFGPLVFYLVFQWIMTAYVLGYVYSDFGLSTILVMMPFGGNSLSSVLSGSLQQYYPLYLSLSALLFILSLIAVRFRRTEKTGQSVAFDVLSYFIRFVISLLVSSALTALVSVASYGESDVTVFLTYLIICLMVVFCVEMIFKKSTHVLYSLKYGVLLAVFGFAILLNGARSYLKSYIPDHVSSVEITISQYDENFPNEKRSDEETIQAVQELHQTILDYAENMNDSIGTYEITLNYISETGGTTSRRYSCDENFIETFLADQLITEPLYSQFFTLENQLLEKLDLGQSLEFVIDGMSYLLTTDEQRYLFKNYLNQELEKAKQSPQETLSEMLSDKTTTVIVYELSDTVNVFVGEKHSGFIARALSKTLKI